MSIAGRSVLVTGGSKGIGKGIARVFARAAARVTIAARDEAVAAATAADLGARHVCGDAGDWDDVQRIVADTVAAQGGLDVLCANAGACPQTRIADTDPADGDDVLRTNLRSAFRCVKAAIAAFEAAGRRRVILTLSITGPVAGYHAGADQFELRPQRRDPVPADHSLKSPRITLCARVSGRSAARIPLNWNCRQPRRSPGSTPTQVSANGAPKRTGLRRRWSGCWPRACAAPI